MDALTLPLAMLATACLPAAVAAIFCADEIIDRLTYTVGERIDAVRERRTIQRLNQMVDVAHITQQIDLSEFDRNDQVPIEQIAAHLRRLGRQRVAADARSRVQQDAINQAYDERLRQACRQLGVAEHLDALDGIDLEIERVRVEGELQAAGLILPAAATERGDQR